MPKYIKVFAEVPLAIGTKVVKQSGKPFKSGMKIGTIKGLTTNEHTGKIAYTFVEDESVVDAFQCKIHVDNMH